ncbi:MAG: hypothetical protein JW804_09285 [Sedimentisphaerales bacterium]|nr:hypothetical protein [Sedimentisphaerales bacterium]
MYASDEYVLLVGLAEFRNVSGTLFTGLLEVETGFEALQQIRIKVPVTLIAPWHLPDMPDGILFRRILTGGTSLPTVALVDSSDFSQEVSARGLGVTVVVDKDIPPSSLGELIYHLTDVHTVTGT